MCTPINSRKFGRPFASIFGRTLECIKRVHTYPSAHTIFGRPYISTCSHICPYSPTKFRAPKQRLDSHVSGKSWTTTKLSGNPRNCTSTHNRGCPIIVVFGRSGVIRGLPRDAMGVRHNCMDTHRVFVGGHTYCVQAQHYAHGQPNTRPTSRIFGLPRVLFGVHNEQVESHVYIWASMTLRGFFVGAQEKFGASPVLSGSPQRYCGGPREYVWARL